VPYSCCKDHHRQFKKKSPDAQEKDLQISIKGLEQGLKWPRSIFFIGISTLEDETAMLCQNVGHQSPCDRTQILEDGRPQMYCFKSLKTWEGSCCFCKMLGGWLRTAVLLYVVTVLLLG